MGKALNARNGGRIFANHPEPWEVSFKVTAAADVAANGYTVNDSGGGLISACTRTAEGDMKIALAEPLAGFRGLSMIASRADSKLTMDNITSIGTASDPHIDVTFTEGGADTDPDSSVMYFTLRFYRTTGA